MRERCSSGGSISASAPMAPIAPTIRTCMRRCGSHPSSRRCEDRIGGAGCRPVRRHWRRPRAAPAPWGLAIASAGLRRVTRPTFMLDLDHPNWLPLNDPVNQLVHTEDGTAVDSVMIGGDLVVENRRIVTVDLDRLRDRIAAARERLAAVNADNRRLYEALVPVVGSYCPGLAAAPYHVHRYGAQLE